MLPVALSIGGHCGHCLTLVGAGAQSGLTRLGTGVPIPLRARPAGHRRTSVGRRDRRRPPRRWRCTGRRSPTSARSRQLVDAYAGPILLEKSLANLFEDVTEFWVAEADGVVVGCGALHVLWEDLGRDPHGGHRPGRPPARRRARGLRGDHRARPADLGLHRLFVLTFEVQFFRSLGFEPIRELDLSREAYAELRSSYDRGVAEFLDLPYVKPNTLGNTRMLKIL